MPVRIALNSIDGFNKKACHQITLAPLRMGTALLHHLRVGMALYVGLTRSSALPYDDSPAMPD